METNFTEKLLHTDPAAWNLVALLQENEDELGLNESQLYFDFPILKDLDEMVVISRLLIVSRQHGIIAVATSNATSLEEANKELPEIDEEVDHVFSLLYSRLVRNKNLRKTKTDLAFPANAILFAPLVPTNLLNLELESKALFTHKQVTGFFEEQRVPPIDELVYTELVATIEGAKGLIRPKARSIPSKDTNSEGYLANKLESEIASFDQRQKQGYMAVLDGLQRIRGLAGSGKTVVLAMKAALTHLRYPEATILYTFYTRSLYQHIQRLITRFYRQFEDRDPDWSLLKVMHAWGGYRNEGVYFNACLANGITPMTFTDAAKSGRDPFDFACSQLLSKTAINATYDYVFIDEGQDFPASFIRLCIKLAEQGRVVFAYDDLQTIFQAATPTLKEIVGTDRDGRPLVELSEDTILYKCYRNPREIIVCAHALGFGIYGSRIVQMLENKEQWEDIGYDVVEGDFVEGSLTVIERPASNSLTTISNHQKPEQIVRALVCGSYEEEINQVSQQIKKDIGEGLRPDDILVIGVDDRYVNTYFTSLTEELAALEIYCNNIHADRYGIRDFHKEGLVTLSTVHKAKGNEAFMVYVMGVDALFTSYAGVRERNLLFTAMTRAKAWVRVSGIGEGAATCKREIDEALKYFPNLVFNYPSREQLKILRRDLADKAIRKQQVERQLDTIMDQMSPEEIKRYIEQRSIKKINKK